jgi:hypothetical protein
MRTKPDQPVAAWRTSSANKRRVFDRCPLPCHAGYGFSDCQVLLAFFVVIGLRNAQ